MKNLDEPAFPQAMDDGTGCKPSVGMSLRDWFAGQALSAMLAQPNQPWVPCRATADEAYQIANWMIDARTEVKG